MALIAHAATAEIKLELKTYDDLLAMPDDGNRYELIFGEIVMSPSPVTKHQYVLAELNDSFRNQVLKRQLGVVFFAPYDVKLSMYNAVVPDLVVIKQERLEIITKKNVDGVPDIVVEVLSPSNRRQDLIRKAALYASFGVPEYWIVDPETDRITVNQLREGLYVAMANSRGFARSAVMPGVKVRVTDIFTKPEWMKKLEETEQHER